MTIKSKRHRKGIITKPTTSPATEEGEQRTDSESKEQKVFLDGQERTVLTEDQDQDISNKTIDDTNTITIHDSNFLITDDVGSGSIEFNAAGSQRTSLRSNSNTFITVDLPSSTTTLVGDDTSDILTNKTISSNNNTITINADTADVSNIETNNLKGGVLNQDITSDSIETVGITNIPSSQAVKDLVNEHSNLTSEVHGVLGNIVGTTDEQNLTNKDLDKTNTFIAAYSTVDEFSNLQIQNENVPTNTLYLRATGNAGTSTVLSSDTTSGFSRSVVLPDDDTVLVGTGTSQQLSNKTMTDELKFKKLGATPTVLGTDEVSIYPKSDGKFYKLTNDGVSLIEEELGTGGGATSFTVSQVNTFNVGDGIYHNGTIFAKAQANLESTLAYYVVTEASGTEFTAVDFGRVQVTKSGHTYVAGQYYYLSTTTAGDSVITEPTTGFSNPLFYVESVNGDDVVLQIKVYRPSAVSQEINLNDLSDVDAVTGLDTGDVLAYDGANWVPTAPSSGGASVLDDLTDVDTTTTTPNNGDILEYNSGTWTPVAPSTGGGGGATVISAGGNLDQATYDGDVILLGNATMLNSVVIRGDLRFIGSSNSLNNGFNGYSLTVHGNVYGNSSTIDLSGLVPSANGGSFTCYGSVYLSSISTFTATASGFAVGTSGSVSINGDYYYPTSGNIYTTGGDSKIAGNSPSNGGTIFIGGNAEFNIIQSSGGNSTESCNLQAGNGGDITIRGNAKSYNTDQIFGTNKYRAIDFSGGHSETSNTNVSAGNAGSLFIGGDLYLAGGFNGTGGNSTDTVGGVGGQGGTVVVEGATSINSGADISGGDALSAAGNADQSGNIIFRGHFNCRGTFKANGGNSTFAGGGNAILAVFFYSNVNINQLQLIGGGAASGFRKGGGCPNCLLQGGGSIETINIRDGGGLGNDSLVAAKVSFEKGHYNVKEILTTSKSANKQRITGIYSSLKVHTTLLNVSDYTNFNNNYITTPSVDIDSIYVFGGTSDVIKKSAAYVDAGTTYTP